MERGTSGDRQTAAVGEPTWTIGELAAEHDVTLRTIRFYEDSGLLAPERRGRQRVYRPRDRVRLRLILRGKRLGFSLGEIAAILDMYEADPGERGQLDYLLAQIAARRAELEHRRRDLDDLLAELSEVEARCRADLAALTRRRTPSSDRATPPGTATARPEDPDGQGDTAGAQPSP